MLQKVSKLFFSVLLDLRTINSKKRTREEEDEEQETRKKINTKFDGFTKPHNLPKSIYYSNNNGRGEMKRKWLDTGHYYSQHNKRLNNYHHHHRSPLRRSNSFSK